MDQVIEIGLPAEKERRLLARRYAGSLRVDDALVEEAARRVGRVSPAFIKELMRRAAQAMLERGAEEAHVNFEYVLRLGDNSLVLGQRLAEWLGHSPILEEDIASANISLDLVGQARLWLTHAGKGAISRESRRAIVGGWRRSTAPTFRASSPRKSASGRPPSSAAPCHC